MDPILKQRLRDAIWAFMEENGIEQLAFGFSAEKDWDGGGNPFLAINLDVDGCVMSDPASGDAPALGGQPDLESGARP